MHWYKIPFFEGIQGLDDIVEIRVKELDQDPKKQAADQKKRAEMAVRLTKQLQAIDLQPTFLFTLGEILAADLFLSNQDRCDSTGWIVNWGNIMFQGSGSGVTNPLALDFFDQAKSTDMGSNLGRGLGTLAGPWTGEVLRTDASIQTYASNVVESFNDGVRAALSVDYLWFEPEENVPKVVNGIKSGREKMKAKLEASVLNVNKPLPPTILERMLVLGWRTQAPRARAMGGLGSRIPPPLQQPQLAPVVPVVVPPPRQLIIGRRGLG